MKELRLVYSLIKQNVVFILDKIKRKENVEAKAVKLDNYYYYDYLMYEDLLSVLLDLSNTEIDEQLIDMPEEIDDFLGEDLFSLCHIHDEDLFNDFVVIYLYKRLKRNYKRIYRLSLWLDDGLFFYTWWRRKRYLLVKSMKKNMLEWLSKFKGKYKEYYWYYPRERVIVMNEALLKLDVTELESYYSCKHKKYWSFMLSEVIIEKNLMWLDFVLGYVAVRSVLLSTMQLGNSANTGMYEVLEMSSIERSIVGINRQPMLLFHWDYEDPERELHKNRVEEYEGLLKELHGDALISHNVEFVEFDKFQKLLDKSLDFEVRSRKQLKERGLELLNVRKSEYGMLQVMRDMAFFYRLNLLKRAFLFSEKPKIFWFVGGKYPFYVYIILIILMYLFVDEYHLYEVFCESSVRYFVLGGVLSICLILKSICLWFILKKKLGKK